MKKQTKRFYSPNKKDVRIRYEKKYTFDNKKKSDKNNNNNNENKTLFVQKIYKTNYNPNMFKPHPIFSSKNIFKIYFNFKDMFEKNFILIKIRS